MLCCFLKKIQNSETKFSALAELNEDFGDKYERLFVNNTYACN